MQRFLLFLSIAFASLGVAAMPAAANSASSPTSYPLIEPGVSAHSIKSSVDLTTARTPSYSMINITFKGAGAVPLLNVGFVGRHATHVAPALDSRLGSIDNSATPMTFNAAALNVDNPTIINL